MIHRTTHALLLGSENEYLAEAEKLERQAGELEQQAVTLRQQAGEYREGAQSFHTNRRMLEGDCPVAPLADEGWGFATPFYGFLGESWTDRWRDR